MLLFYFKPQNQCWAQKRCKWIYNVFALNVEVMQRYIFTKYWNNSRFKQNLAIILTEAMYLDRRHPFMQKSYFGQNVTYTVFALRGRSEFLLCTFWKSVQEYYYFHQNSTFEPPHDKTNKMTVRPAKTQISLGIRPVWSESSPCAQWVAKDPSFLHADSKDSDQTQLMPRLIRVFAGCTCHFVGFFMRRLILNFFEGPSGCTSF